MNNNPQDLHVLTHSIPSRRSSDLYDLANQFGNLAQRVLSMIAKNCDGKVPQPGEFTQQDGDLLEETLMLRTDVRVDMERQQFHVALTRIWDLVGEIGRAHV